LTLAASVAPTIGLVHHIVHEGNMDQGLFSEYVASLARTLDARLPGQRCCFVIDNLSSHKKEILDAILVPRGHVYLFLPPYSHLMLMLNPIEHSFWVVKNAA